MKKENYKTDATIESEKKEAAELIERILSKTNTIPPRVMAGSYQTAVSYKDAALSARKQAESKAPRLAKLRDAWLSIQHYYA